MSGRGSEPDMESWIRARVPACAGLEEGGLVHRLDLPTSGTLLAATDAATRHMLREAMSGRGERVIDKEYLARCVNGVAECGSFELYFTKRHRGSRKMTVRTSGEKADCGRCAWRILERDVQRGDLLTISLIGPGRRHIIRAGFAHLGHPLIGDALYGEAEGTPQLHAASLTVQRVRVEAPVPVWGQPS
ncbi:MAG: pseudouridine synthase [Phycisphaerales bacterium]|nr:pseudouridine synthase [Phycisphaerales bacterium]